MIFAGEASLRTIEEFRKQHIPMVLVNNRLDLDELVCVAADHYGGAVQRRRISASGDIERSLCWPAGFLLGQ